MKFYEASNAGVPNRLHYPWYMLHEAQGYKGVSEKYRVISIIGRFLEHSRIYYFHHAGKAEGIFIIR